jgi:4-amino-4-deoxy-L-arabinose transferase-like glycosyltransferase
MIKKPWLILLGIILLGLAVRTYRIQALPMYGDELTTVYDTYSIAKTGMDSTGERMPLTFKMGAGRPGGYIYFSVPFVELFGPTILGVRALSILSGLGIILLMYFLGKKLFNEKIGILASILAAVSPWDIYLSRGGFEAHFALFLALLGITAFLYKRYIFWGIAWGLAIHTYPTFKLTLPMIGILLVWFTGIKGLIKSKLFIIGLVFLLFFGGLAIRETLKGLSEQRFFSTNVLADQNSTQIIIQRVNYERTVSGLPGVIKALFINRKIEYGRALFDNYIKNISPDFLFNRGDGNPVHNPGESGMFYLIELPLLLAGLFFLFKDKRKEFLLLTTWILITPLATMFFPEAHALRNGLMLPAFICISAYALMKIPRRLVYLTVLLILFQFVYILVRVYFIAPSKFALFWSAPAQKVALDAVEKSKNGQKVILSTQKIDNIEYAYEVYANVDPQLVIAQFGKFPKVYGNVSITDK